MDILIDTHVFLWWDNRDRRLNAQARSAITDPGNRIFVSAGSVWEIAIKRRRGKLSFEGSPAAAIGSNGFYDLPILVDDAEMAGDLEWSHSDPFDRVLVAQARRLSLTLVTADSTIRTYREVAQLWAG